VIVHLYAKLTLELCPGHSQKSLKSRRFVFDKISTLYQFHTRLFERNRFRKFVSDLWIDRGLKLISGVGPLEQ
jgi:hypothetical protein